MPSEPSCCRRTAVGTQRGSSGWRRGPSTRPAGRAFFKLSSHSWKELSLLQGMHPHSSHTHHTHNTLISHSFLTHHTHTLISHTPHTHSSDIHTHLSHTYHIHISHTHTILISHTLITHIHSSHICTHLTRTLISHTHKHTYTYTPFLANHISLICVSICSKTLAERPVCARAERSRRRWWGCECVLCAHASVPLRGRGSHVGSSLRPAGQGPEQLSGCDLRLLLPRIFESGP